MASLAPLRIEITGNSRGAVTAINQTKTALTGLESAGQKLQNFGQGLSNIGRNLTTGVTVPLAAIGVASVKMAAQYEDSLSQIQGATRATAGELANIDRYIFRITEGSIYGPREVSEAWLSLAKGGLTQAQIKAGALQTTLDLATASGMALGDSADIITRGAKAFDLSVSDIPRVADALVGAADASTANVDDLAAAFSQAASSAAATGLSIEETAGALAFFSDRATAVGSDAGTALKTYLSRLTDPAAKAAIDKYNLNFVDQAGNIKGLLGVQKQLQQNLGGLTQAEQKAAIQTIFGADAGRAALAVLRDRNGSLKEAVQAARDQEAAERASAARQGKISESLKKAQVALERAGIKVGRALAPAVERAAKWIGQLADKFSRLSPAVQDFIVKAGIVTAVLGPVAVVAGNVASALGGMLSIFGKIGKATGLSKMTRDLQGVERGASNASRSLGVIPGILSKIAAIASVPIIWQGFSGGIDALSKGWSQQFPQLTGAVEAFGTTVKRMVPGVGQFVVLGEDLQRILDQSGVSPDALGGVKKFIDEMNRGTGILDAFASAWDELWGGIQGDDLGNAIGAGIKVPDFREQLRSQINAIDADIKAKKFQLRATADPAIKELRRAELPARQAARREYRIKLSATGAEKVANDAERAAKAAERWANKQYKAALKADNRDAKSAIREAERDASRYKNQAASKRLDADNSPLKGKVSESQRRVDGLKQGKPVLINADGAPAQGVVDGLTTSLGTLVSTAWNVVVSVVASGPQKLLELAGLSFYGLPILEEEANAEVAAYGQAAAQSLSRARTQVQTIPFDRLLGGKKGGVSRIDVSLNLQRTGDWTIAIRDLTRLQELASETNKDGKATARAKAARKELAERRKLLEEYKQTMQGMGATYNGEKRSLKELTTIQQRLRENYALLRGEMTAAINGASIGTAWDTATSKIEELKSTLESLTGPPGSTTEGTLNALKASLAENAWNPDAVIYYQGKIKEVENQIGFLKSATKDGAATGFTQEALQKQLEKTRQFYTRINKLRQQGLGNDALQEVVRVGPDQGAELAGALVNSKKLRDEYTKTYNTAGNLSRQLGNTLAEDAFGKPLRDVNDAMFKIIQRLNKWLKKADKKTIIIDYKWDAGTFVPDITGSANRVSTGRPGKREASVVNNIYVNAGIANPEETARELESVLAGHTARMGGWV